MVRIGPLSIGVLGLATLALLVPVAQGFTKAGGVGIARGAGKGLAGFLEDPFGLFSAKLGDIVGDTRDVIQKRGTDDAIKILNERDRIQAETDRRLGRQTVPSSTFANFGTALEPRVEFQGRTGLPIGFGGGFGLSDLRITPTGETVFSREAQDQLDAERRALASSGGFF